MFSFSPLYISSLDRLSRPSPYPSIMPPLHHNMSVSLGAPTLDLSIIPSLSESLHQINLLTLPGSTSNLPHSLAFITSLSFLETASSHENLLTSIRCERTNSLILTYMPHICRNTEENLKHKEAALLPYIILCKDLFGCLM